MKFFGPLQVCTNDVCILRGMGHFNIHQSQSSSEEEACGRFVPVCFELTLRPISNGSLELALEIGKYLDYCGAKRAPLEPFSSVSLVEHATLEEKHHFLRSPTSPTSFLPIWRHPALSCRGSQVQICVKPCGAAVFSLCLRAEDSFLTMTAGVPKTCISNKRSRTNTQTLM